MIFQTISIKNFFSVTEEIQVSLKNQGLVLITGENHDSSAADSNGAGKSTIFEAMLWCLWGKTVRGIAHDAVVNRKTGKNCCVELLIEDGGKIFSIQRYRKHVDKKNELIFECEGVDLTQGKSDLTQTKINEFLGIEYDGFIRGPMMPQGAFKRFSQMTDAEQKDILENALQLNLLSKARVKVQEQLALVESDIRGTETSLRMSRDELAKVKSNLSLLQREKDAVYQKHLHNKAIQLSSFLREVIEYEKFIIEQEETVDTNSAKETLAKVKVLEEKIRSTWLAKVAEVDKEILEQHKKIEREATKLHSLQDDINTIKQQKPGSLCPTCFQLITPEHVGSCLNELNTKHKLWQPMVKNLQEELKKLQVKLADLKKQQQESLQKAYAARDQAQERVLQATKASEADRYRREFIKRFEDRLETRLVKPLKDESASLMKLIQLEIRRVQEIEDQITQAEKDLSVYQDKAAYLKFWENGFSNAGLKSKILASVTPFLNSNAERYIRDLTDGELAVEFSTQLQLKSGVTREKFSVEILNKHGAKSYDGSSGGEKARADLAINFTLSDLVASRSKKSYPQRFFDEPFESLDEAGIEAVMDLLVAMSKTCGTILVITHQATFKSLFNKVLTMSKRNGVTMLEAA